MPSLGVSSLDLIPLAASLLQEGFLFDTLIRMSAWMKPDTFEAVIDPWTAPRTVQAPYKPAFADDEKLKQAYGVSLAKGLSAFDAGMAVFNQELPSALWAGTNWVNDPFVQASKDAYIKALKKVEKPLDKDELLAKVLSFADERINGLPLVEAKVRLDALKLYSEISGFTGRVNIDASTNIDKSTTNINNEMKIVLVKGSDETKLIKTIDNSNTQSKIQNNADAPSLALKLVGGSSR